MNEGDAYSIRKKCSLSLFSNRLFELFIGCEIVIVILPQGSLRIQFIFSKSGCFGLRSIQLTQKLWTGKSFVYMNYVRQLNASD